MMYPLVRELAVDGVPVTVTCRVLNIARQPYYRWLKAPITDGELDDAYLANAIIAPNNTFSVGANPGVRLPVPRRRTPGRRTSRV